MVEDLVDVLREIDGDDSVFPIQYVHAEHATPVGNSELIDRASQLAEKELIKPNGENDWVAH